MVLWWESLTTLERVLACLACPATLILVIQTVMLLFGLGSGGDTDFETDIDGDGIDDATQDISDGVSTDLRIFTVRGFVAFFCVFGWSGLAMTRGGVVPGLAVTLAAIFGLAAMFLIALALRWAMKLQYDGTVNLHNAVGVSANVYLSIPPARSGQGKVTALIQERLVECQAVTDEETPLPTGTSVVVTGISGGNVLVVRRQHT